MSTVNICAVKPSHPCIKRLTLSRTLASGDTLYGCVCGMIYADTPSDKLAVAGHTAPSLRLTAICWQPETLMPQDTLRADDGSEYRLCSVSRLDGSVLTAVVAPASGQ